MQHMALLATTAAVATAACIDSVLGVSTDLNQFRHERAFAKRLHEHIQRLGDRVTLYHLLQLADSHAEALWFEGRSWNYGAMKRDVDKVAIGLQHLGVKSGDLVAVYMTNSPEMVFTIYAISKLGASPALISSALRDDTLCHCVKIAQATTMICTPDLAEFAASAIETLGMAFQCISLNLGSFQAVTSNNSRSNVSDFINSVSQSTEETNIDKNKPIVRSVADIAALLYTSGTTGKPKACCVRNLLICITSCATAADMSNPQKFFPVRTYSCMPLFHGTTFLTGLCYSVGTSGTFCLARKFSASRLWADVVESRTTRLLYVGELCRYLCAAPPSRFDRAHGCIVATGNGLQKDVWRAFKARFGVPEIREYYRSTEGLAKFDNRNRGAAGTGKIGFAGLLRRRVLEEDVFIVRFDFETEKPLRDPRTGFCTLAPLGEPGEAIGRIKSMAVYTNYLGNKEATEAKILRDVFRKGDLFQRSGDLVVQERLGWIRFHDRIGETFRWKGENISAGEVGGFICELPEVQDAVVVGKRLTGYDGQAGAAAVTLKATKGTDEKAFMKTLYSNLKRRGLPAYAFPRLVTVTDNIAINATFKHANQALKAYDWNPEAQNATGSTYWLDGAHYKPLQKESWANIEAGRAKL